MKIERQNLGLAAEFATASELCRRNLYAQLTLGLRKRTDLLIDTDEGMLRIQVKAKQGPTWPNCRGVYGDAILVLVDYQNKEETERPDFYILTADDWKKLIEEVHSDKIKTGEVIIDDKNVLIWPKQITKSGKPYRGHTTSLKQVEKHRDTWDKIADRTQ